MTQKNQTWIFVSRPQGEIIPDNFMLEASPVPEPEPGAILIRTLFLSVDPYMRNRMNNFARIVLCGQISQYNNTRIVMGPILNALLLIHRALMKGFIVYDYQQRFDEAREQLRKWVSQDKLVPVMEIQEGFESLPKALISLFSGKNTGKLVVKI
ncbi:MAG: hypothetical protein GXO83_13490 [Chlorobi bacterium]|nr:hypothetical protein [Chlorobiota bacterium]